MKEFGPSAVKGLVRKGLVAQEWVRGGRQRSPDYQLGLPPTLTPEQADVVDFVQRLLGNERAAPRSVLLHGVTGSGKTEVYLRALERCVSLGRRGILLVPEISMTPQMEERINARFPRKGGPAPQRHELAEAVRRVVANPRGGVRRGGGAAERPVFARAESGAYRH